MTKLPQCSEAAPSDLSRLGGEVGLAALIDVFIDRVACDVMIGYLFGGVDLKRLKRREVAFAAHHLGGTPYAGQSMRAAHARLTIAGGHFARRKVILGEVLRAHAVPQDIIARWLAHQDSLRPEVVKAGPVCPSDL